MSTPKSSTASLIPIGDFNSASVSASPATTSSTAPNFGKKGSTKGKGKKGGKDGEYYCNTKGTSAKGKKGKGNGKYGKGKGKKGQYYCEEIPVPAPVVSTAKTVVGNIKPVKPTKTNATTHTVLVLDTKNQVCITENQNGSKNNNITPNAFQTINRTFDASEPNLPKVGFVKADFLLPKWRIFVSKIDLKTIDKKSKSGNQILNENKSAQQKEITNAQEFFANGDLLEIALAPFLDLGSVHALSQIEDFENGVLKQTMDNVRARVFNVPSCFATRSTVEDIVEENVKTTSKNIKTAKKNEAKIAELKKKEKEEQFLLKYSLEEKPESLFEPKKDAKKDANNDLSRDILLQMHGLPTNSEKNATDSRKKNNDKYLEYKHDGIKTTVKKLKEYDALGVGITVDIDLTQKYERKSLACCFDFLSKKAFYDYKVKASALKDELVAWLPLAINKNHFDKIVDQELKFALDALAGKNSTVKSMTQSFGTQMQGTAEIIRSAFEENVQNWREYEKYRCVSSAAVSETFQNSTAKDFEPALNLLPNLMNSQIVGLLKGQSHLSESALNGFFGFHHLFLSILRKFPELQEQVEKQIEEFMSSEAKRSKAFVPNLGEWLCLLSVSKKYSWKDVAALVVRESAVRGRSWGIDKYPELGEEYLDAKKRASLCFKSNIVAIRLLMFQVYFLKSYCGNLDKQFAFYERFNGVPANSDVVELQKNVKEICSETKSWSKFFEFVGIEALNLNDLNTFLYEATELAVCKEYIKRFMASKYCGLRKLLPNENSNGNWRRKENENKFDRNWRQ